VGGVCICDVLSCSTTFPGFSCCANSRVCGCHPNLHLDLSTCTGVSQCPFGSTPCVATTNTCNGGPAKVCCPVGSTCTPQGTCRIA
jgi:hypothetical protein